MGNTTSNEDSVKRQPLDSRRQSNRSTFSSRFSISSGSSYPWTGNTSDQPRKDSTRHHHGILSRLKNKAHHKKNSSSISSTSTSGKSHPPILEMFARISTEEPLEGSASSSSTLKYHSPPFMSTKFPIIEKYTDSQMTLLEHNQQYQHQHNPQAGGCFHDNQSSPSVNSLSTTQTTSSLHNEEPISYSSEAVLEELYMSSETSPERRRDRDRKHRQHYLLKRTWGKNYKIPLSNPSLIVDWCCATAVWDIELAFEFPEAKVIGIDYETATVSSLTNTIKNFSFHNAMIHQGDTGLKEFGDNQVDYLVMRDVWLVNTPTSKWPELLKEVYRVLKPGGYIEIYEQDKNFKSMGPNLAVMEQWADRFFDAIKFDRSTISKLSSYLENAGYANIKEESVELPVGEWPKSKDLKETGYLQKDITERQFRESKRWLCKLNNLTDKQYSSTLNRAIDECDDYNTTVCSFYFSAQKPTDL